MIPGAAALTAEPAPRSVTSRTAFVGHPAVDFLVVGGASVLVFAVIILSDGAVAVERLTAVALVGATLVAYPHFAHSYQILYTGFAAKIRSAGTPARIRRRYLWAGIGVPLGIAAFVAAACASGDPRILGVGANVMLVLVGWHYVKQGYGVLVTFSALRGIRYGASERRWLLWNGYAVWIHSWIALQQGLREERLSGIPYFTLDLPAEALRPSAFAAVVTTLVVAVLLFRRRREPMPWNGVVGYVAALYLWVVARYVDPLFALFVPIFHSLQYLLFVWRHELERSPGPGAIDPLSPGRRLAGFVLVGIALGWLGFVGLPELFQQLAPPDPEVWGPGFFGFVFLVAINVHHYFIDNVIWRSDDEHARLLLRR